MRFSGILQVMARLARVIAPGYRRHVTQRGNRRHLWRKHFASFVLGDDWLLGAARCIERNPVKTGLAEILSRHGRGGFGETRTSWYTWSGSWAAPWREENRGGNRVGAGGYKCDVP